MEGVEIKNKKTKEHQTSDNIHSGLEHQRILPNILILVILETETETDRQAEADREYGRFSVEIESFDIFPFSYDSLFELCTHSFGCEGLVLC